MLAPIAQITCIATRMEPPISGMPRGENVARLLRTNTSMKINHAARLTRNCASACRLFRAVISPALVPASSTNTGAQKCVIQRVKKTAAVILGLVIGSCSVPTIVKSRTWSMAMITMTSPRTMSIALNRYAR